MTSIFCAMKSVSPPLPDSHQENNLKQENKREGSLTKLARAYFGDSFKEDWRGFCNASRCAKPLKLPSELRLLFDQGLCFGAALTHFCHFFYKDPSLSREEEQAGGVPSLLPFGKTSVVKEGLLFRSFDLSAFDESQPLSEKQKLQDKDFETLKKKLQKVRFIQAAHEISMTALPCFKKEESGLSEILPLLILKKLGFSITSITAQHPIADLPLELSRIDPKEVARERFYIINITSPMTKADAHAIGFYPSHPHHFIDINHGVAISRDRQALILFLSSHLQVYYEHHTKFCIIALDKENRL